ncbi:MAG: alpha/beta fold hydrolase [Candidatus Schekmanbacteria bacterium]|nr:MAG: alpha/beta fold hydrolase [Candidatus Schekmanbacteria bacterium]
MIDKRAISLIILSILFLSYGCKMKEFKEIKFKTSDNAEIEGSLFCSKTTDSGVVLVHGMVFNRESWYDFAGRLADEGFCALAINLRGYGNSIVGEKGKDVMYPDVLGAVQYLKDMGIENIAVVGGSMGALASIDAVIEDKKKEIKKLVLLSPPPHPDIEKISIPTLFAYSKDERLAGKIKEMYNEMSCNKEIAVFDGNAHAQHIFKTENKKALEDKIVAFLNE